MERIMRTAFHLAILIWFALFALGVEPALPNGKAGYMGTLAPILLMKVQETLTEKGFNAGGVDGKWGGKTRAALHDFRINAGLPLEDTDYLTPDLVKALWEIDVPDSDGYSDELSEDEQAAVLNKLGLLAP
jgi:peptidoglycan hydrolase-like protein with peptidoglycan-binding domain